MRALLVALVLLLAAPSSAQSGPEDWFPYWDVMAWGCADSYDTPVPPAGAVDFRTGATFPDHSVGYDLLLNKGAPTQTSGSPDGLCDNAPQTIEGNFTTSVASQYLELTIYPPPAGFVVMHQGILCPPAGNYSYGVSVRFPWDPFGAFSYPAILGQKSALCLGSAVDREYMGPLFIQGSVSLKQNAGRFPLTSGQHTFWWSSGAVAGTWSGREIRLVPLRTDPTHRWPR
jgi:hypothetical protein